MNTKTLDPALLAAQMEAWPDSIVLTDSAMMYALCSAYPEHLKGVEREMFDKCKNMSVHKVDAEYAKLYKEVAEYRAIWARSAFVCRMQGQGGSEKGFFYACGKQADGTYRHVGFRYGTDLSEYMSGFHSLTYTPQPEKETV